MISGAARSACVAARWSVGNWQRLIAGIRQLPPDRVRFWLIRHLAGDRSILINVKITGLGNTIGMSDPALIAGVVLDRSTPAEDTAITIIANENHG